jgi:hypothetical protein
MTPGSRPADPVFIGGAGRSGLQAVARLVGAHRRYHYLDAQVRFHVDEGGIPDLIEGRVDLPRFLERMRGYWWFHTRAQERESGLHQLLGRAEFDRVVGEFERSFEGDPDGASGRLVRSLIDPLARGAGADSWVEWSTRSAAAAPTLARLFPDCKVLHVVRDGRDVACSLASLPWGPDSVDVAVAGWQRMIRAADAGTRELPPDRVMTLNIADLAIDDREPSYDRLLEFLGVDDDTGIREHFENKLLPGAANPGRWEIDLAPTEQRELARAYDQALSELRADGVEVAEELSRRMAAVTPGERA